MDRIVLDTNVLLDWLVFDEPSVRNLGLAVEQGLLAWLHCPPMLVEFEHMVRHPSLAGWEPDLGRCLSAPTRLGRSVDAPATGHRSTLRCTDADDQVFVDLALAQRARWLVSRDRAVLKLARRARALGLQVLTPQAWTVDFERGAPP